MHTPKDTAFSLCEHSSGNAYFYVTSSGVLKFIFDEAGLKAFAKRLKKVRKMKNLSQEELALRTELTLSQIARIETAKINTTLSTVFRIARILDIELPELFDFKLPANDNSRGKYIIKDDNFHIAAEE